MIRIMDKFAADFGLQLIAANRIISALDAGLILKYSLTIVSDIRFSIKYFLGDCPKKP